MTPFRLTVGSAAFTVQSIPARSCNLDYPSHVLHRLALDPLHHRRGDGAGRAQCDAAAIDGAARHLGRHQYPLPVWLSVLGSVFRRRADPDRRSIAVADTRVLAMAFARRALPDRRHRTDAARDERAFVR